MKVQKRNGTTQELDIAHIRKQTIPACEGLTNVSYEELELGAKIMFTDGITTKKIQEALIRSAESKIALDAPDWMYVAARLRLYDLYHRIKHYYGHTGADKDGDVYDKVDLYTVINKNSDIYTDRITSLYSKDSIDELNKEIKSERDKLLTTAAVQTLVSRYLGVRGSDTFELPQHMFMLIAMFVASDEESEEKRVHWSKIYYEELSSLRMIAATPINSNGRFKDSSTASCFLASFPDNIEGIFDGYKEVARASKAGGGLGIDISRMRALGSRIRHRDNAAGGVIPFTKVLNDIALAVDQGGVRAGAFATYLECWHIDFPDFLDLCKRQGEDRRRAQDLFLAASIPDIFIKRIKESGMWTLFDPRDVPELTETYGDEFTAKYEEAERNFIQGIGKWNPNTKQIPVKELLGKMIYNWSTEGKLFWFFKDTVNRAHEHKDLGIIRSSNLCVTGDTNILTKEYGYIPIAMLVESGIEYATCWNGKEWSWTNLFKTSNGQSVLTVTLSNGETIKATPYHKWYKVKDNYQGVEEKRTFELKPGDKLERFNLSIVDHGTDVLPHAYTNGFYTADGCTTSYSTGVIHLYDDKIKLLPYLSGYTTVSNPTIANDGRNTRQTVYFRNSTLYPKFFIPRSNFRLQDRIDWISGLIDGDGALTVNNGAQSIQICTTNYDFAKELVYFFQELGVDAKLNKASEGGSQLLPANDGTNGYKYFNTAPSYRILIPGSSLNKLIDLGLNTKRVIPVKHNYNRVATEFVRVVSVVDEGYVMATYCGNEPKRHKLMFNGVLTGNCVEITQPTDENHTAVCNLGSLNLGQLKTVEEMVQTSKILTRFLDSIVSVTDYPTLNSRETQLARRSIGIGVIGEAEWLAQNHIMYGSDEHEHSIIDIYGNVSKAIEDTSKELAKEKGSCVIDGIRNAYRMAIAPNTSSGLLAGSTCSCEPIYAREWAENSKLGTYKMVAPHVTVDNLKYYPNAYELDQGRLLELTALRQKYVDMSISHSVYIDPTNYMNTGKPVSARDIARLILKAHELGVKTLYYFRAKARKNTNLEATEKPKISCVGCEN